MVIRSQQYQALTTFSSEQKLFLKGSWTKGYRMKYSADVKDKPFIKQTEVRDNIFGPEFSYHKNYPKIEQAMSQKSEVVTEVSKSRKWRTA